jgi:biotin carboxyl carrier protein
MMSKVLRSGSVACRPCTTRVGASNVPQFQKIRPTRRMHAVAEADSAVTAPAKDVEAEDVPEYLPSKQQVQALITTLCEETEIAEMHLQMGTFQLKIRRSTSSAAAPAAPPANYYAAPAAAPAIPPVAASVEEPEESVDETTVFIEAPKVGVFHRGRYAGGKRIGKANCVEKGDTVKKGQTLGFIEQLGTFIEVKSPQGGEIIKVLLEDGSAVEYKQTIFEMAPYFGGHIIGDKKWAI